MKPNLKALEAAVNDSVTLAELTSNDYSTDFPEVEETEPDEIHELQCEINSIRRDQRKHLETST